MVFKPFKPPLMRKPPSKSKDTDDTFVSQAPPSKRRRVSDDGDGTSERDDVTSSNKISKRNAKGTGQASTARKPLVQVKNSVAEIEKDASTTAEKTAAVTGRTGEEGQEYYNVLWFVSSICPT